MMVCPVHRDLPVPGDNPLPKAVALPNVQEMYEMIIHEL